MTIEEQKEWYDKYYGANKTIPKKPHKPLGNPLTIPWRACRHGATLVCGGHTLKLLEEVGAFVASWLYTPAFKKLRCKVLNSVSCHTDYPIAVGSPDVEFPWGAAYNWITNRAFIVAMHKKYGNFGSFLDLGCATGRLVQDFAETSWLSVGLEGSDFPKKNKVGPWSGNYNLYSCDIGKPFTISEGSKIVKFQVVTAWHVLEHLDKHRLEELCKNVQKHTAKDSIFIVTTDNCTDIHNGIDLHVTQWNRQQWNEFFGKNLPDFVEVKMIPWYQKLRRSFRGLDFCFKRIV